MIEINKKEKQTITNLEKCNKIVEYIEKNTLLFPENPVIADYSHIICLEKQGIKINKLNNDAKLGNCSHG
jgi:hypothetical protein